MCTYIANTARVTGGAKGAAGWFRITDATVAFDHPTFTSVDHALLIDFTSAQGDLSARVGVELDLDSGRALLAALAETIRAAEASGVAA
jgi:Family of unknown function (DUF6295)